MPAVYALTGPQGSAKSTFGLTIPGRKFIFDLEFGADRATWRFDPCSDCQHLHMGPVCANITGDSVCSCQSTERAIGRGNYDLYRLNPAEDPLDILTFTKGDRVRNQLERWHTITAKYVEVLKDDIHPVIIFDTAKELWTTAHQAVLQEKQNAQLTKVFEAAVNDKRNPFMGTILDYEEQFERKVDWRVQLQPIEYSSPNGRMNNVMDLAKQFGKTLVLINHERDEYGPRMVGNKIEDVKTGKKELDGYKNTLDKADWVLVTRAVPLTKVDTLSKTIEVPAHFIFTVAKSPAGIDLLGQEYKDLQWPELKKIADAKGVVRV